MTQVIVGIHGLGNKPEKLLYSQWWVAAMEEGLDKNCGVRNAGFQFILVYWADLLYKYQLHQDHHLDFDPLYLTEPYVEAEPGALKEYREGWVDAIRGTAGGAVGGVADWVQGLAGVERIGQWILRETDAVRDVGYYYDTQRMLRGRDGRVDSARRVLMNELMNTLLPLQGQRLMLIAHSMGSIIAYDVLRDLGQRDAGFPVHHFVTMGSPLGLPPVRKNIYTERSYADVPVRTPTVVRERWVNYADRRDLVALDTHLRDDFGPNSSGVRVEDDLIVGFA